jgi:hypothetical protein
LPVRAQVVLARLTAMREFYAVEGTGAHPQIYESNVLYFIPRYCAMMSMLASVSAPAARCGQLPESTRCCRSRTTGSRKRSYGASARLFCNANVRGTDRSWHKAPDSMDAGI